jgi:hypothetical protein
MEYEAASASKTKSCSRAYPRSELRCVSAEVWSTANKALGRHSTPVITVWSRSPEHSAGESVSVTPKRRSRSKARSARKRPTPRATPSTAASRERTAPIRSDSFLSSVDEVQALCACTLVVASLLFWVVHRALIDDGYITLSYARNLALHGHWGLIPQESANTASSPLFVMLVAAPTVVLRDAIWGAGAAFVGANVMLAWWASKTSGALGLTPGSAALAVALVLLNPLLLSATGMETTLAVALIVGLLCYAVQGRPVAFGVISGLAILTRPDLIIFVGLLALSTSEIRGRLAKAAGAAAVVSLPWMAWSWLHFGSAIPDTYVLKTLQRSFAEHTFTTGPFLMLERNAAATVMSFAPALVGSALLLVMAATRIRHTDSEARRLDPILALGAGGIGYYVAYSVLGVPPYQWYYGPVIAALAVFVGLLLPQFLSRVTQSASVRRRLVMTGQVLLAVTVLAEAVVVIGHDLPWRESVIQSNFATQAEYARVGTSLQSRVEDDQAVMNLGEIGTVAYFCQCALVDHFSDRGWIVPQVEKRIARAGPVARFLLRLNYRYLDRDLLPRPPEYTLVWGSRGGTDDPNAWDAGRGRLFLQHQLTQRRMAATAKLYIDLLGHLDPKALGSMARDVVASLPPGRGPVLLGVSSPFDRYYQFRLAAELKRRHVLVRLDPETAGTPGDVRTAPAPEAPRPASPERRTYDGRPVRVVLTVSSGYDINRTARSAAQVVAYVGAVSRAQRVEVARRARQIEALNRAGRLSDRDYVNAEVSALSRLGMDLAVVSSG